MPGNRQKDLNYQPAVLPHYWLFLDHGSTVIFFPSTLKCISYSSRTFNSFDKGTFRDTFPVNPSSVIFPLNSTSTSYHLDTCRISVYMSELLNQKNPSFQAVSWVTSTFLESVISPLGVNSAC